MRVGIVGHEGAKFTPETEAKAREVIRDILRVLVPGADSLDAVVSGHCHLGGIDIWAEEEAKRAGIPTRIYPPKRLTWSGGYKERNLQIAADSDVVHCIVVARLPESYTGMRFEYCYHCKTKDHVKSGGCWTAKRAKASHIWVIE